MNWLNITSGLQEDSVRNKLLSKLIYLVEAEKEQNAADLSTVASNPGPVKVSVNFSVGVEAGDNGSGVYTRQSTG